jgi:hypothetical protein
MAKRGQLLTGCANCSGVEQIIKMEILVIGRHNILPAALIVLSIINLGCTTNVKKVVHKTSTDAQADQVLLIEPKESCRVSLSTLGYDGTALAFSMNQAHMNAAMTNPQYDPASGLAVVLIGGAIVKGIAQSRAQNKANEPVANWLGLLNDTDWEVAFNGVKKAYRIPVFINTLDVKKQKGNTLRLTHSLAVSANYGSLQLIVLAELVSHRNEIIYRNYFHIQSRWLLEDSEQFSELNTKDRKFADKRISSMLAKVPSLVFSDMSKKSGKLKNTEVRFTNHMGKYFEMGKVLAANEGYITFRTLRGEIKHYPYITIK